MKFSYQVNGQLVTIQLDATPEGLCAKLNEDKYNVRIIHTAPNEVTFMIGDVPFRAHTAFDGTRRWVHLNGQTFVLGQPEANGRRRRVSRETDDPGGEREIIAPMPGQIRAVNAAQGEQVEKGQTLLLLEAMKMEIRIQAPRSGKLTKLSVEKGQRVERDQVLAEIE